MYIDFEQIAPVARIWVYQCKEHLPKDKSAEIEAFLQTNVDGWAAHSHPLRASFKIIDSRFIVLAVNDLPSGCSIDSSVKWVQQAAQMGNTEALDRSIIVKKGTETIELAPFGLKNSLERNNISVNDLVYDVLVETKEGLDNFLKPVGKSWLAKYY